jgi:predicted CDP-diglyceride synthetase/phosphatidate cytidylyltransferase
LRVIPAQTKLVLGGVVIFAAASLVLGWTRNFSLAATIEIAVIILIFGVLLSAVSAAPARRFGAGDFLHGR